MQFGVITINERQIVNIKISNSIALIRNICVCYEVHFQCLGLQKNFKRYIETDNKRLLSTEYPLAWITDMLK